MSEAQEQQLIGLCRAYQVIFPQASFHYGHIVIDDYNLELSSIEWALEHLDDFHADTSAEYGEVEAKLWRDTTYHLLNVLKRCVENWD